MSSHTIETVTAYIHPCASDVWSYSARFADGHEESGALDVDADDEIDAIVDAVEATVTAHGGTFAEGSMRSHGADRGSHVWSAA